MTESQKRPVLLTVSLIVHDDYTYIAGAIRSLYATTRANQFHIYVVINAGSEGKTAQLRAEFPEITYIINENPQGFAANHNMVMRLAETEYVALLNDDILIHDNALDRLLNYLQAHDDIAVVGGQLLNSDGSKQVSVYNDPGLLRSIYKISGLASLTHQHSRLRRLLLRLGMGKALGIESLKTDSSIRDVPVVKGAVMIVRRSANEQVGGMDETTLAFGEEYDWHLRLRQAGWRVVFVPDAHITHYGTGQATLQLHGRLLIEDRKASLYYYLKHRPRWQGLVIRWTIIISHLFWGLVWLLPNREKAKTHFNTCIMAIYFNYR